MLWSGFRRQIVAGLLISLCTLQSATAEEDAAALRAQEMYAPFRDEAQNEWRAIKAGILSSFRFPIEDWLTKKHESEWRNLIDGFSASTSFGYPLTELSIENNGIGSQGTRSGSAPSITQTVSYNPISAWKASISFIHRLTEADNAPWEGDFVYSFGYSDWRPYTLSLMYSNFGANRLSPDYSSGEKITTFELGTLTLGWKFPVHPSVFRRFALTESSAMGCTLSYGWTPRWQGLDTGGLVRDKHKTSLGCKYTIWGSFYTSFALNYFPKRGQQQPWDADYTYGFGYFDWRTGTFSVQYNNYSGNRFPWRKQPRATGRFKNGGLSVSYSWPL